MLKCITIQYRGPGIEQEFYSTVFFHLEVLAVNELEQFSY